MRVYYVINNNKVYRVFPVLSDGFYIQGLVVDIGLHVILLDVLLNFYSLVLVNQVFVRVFVQVMCKVFLRRKKIIYEMLLKN